MDRGNNPAHWLVRILMLAAIVYLAGNASVHLWDRDEPRYAQTSKQMLQRGDWVVPILLDELRTAKPIFTYWCQIASMKIFGTGEFGARFPSAVATVLMLALLGWGIARVVGWTRALWSVFILATAGLVIAAAKMCITDGILLLFVTAAQMALFNLYRLSRGNGVRLAWPREDKNVPHSPMRRQTGMSAPPAARRFYWFSVLALWVAIALAGLTKGPVVLGVQISTMLILLVLDVGRNWRSGRAWLDAMRWWRHTHPWVGLPILVVIVGPWLWMIHQREPEFLPRIIGHDVITRISKPLEGHKGPPGYYLASILATFFPWSLFLFTTFKLGWKHRRLTIVRFCLAAVIGPWITWELIQTKLMHYILPAFPALGFLTADALVRCFRRQHDDLHRPITPRVTLVWSIVVAGLGLLPWLAYRQFDDLPWMIMSLISLMGLAYAGVVYIYMRRQRLERACAAMGLGMAAVIVVFYALYLPRADFFRMPQRIAAALPAGLEKGQVVMLDYKEDSLPYYQGGTIREPGPWPPRVAPLEKDLLRLVYRWEFMVMTRQQWESLPAVVKRSYVEVQSVRGIAYADAMTPTEVVVVRRVD